MSLSRLVLRRCKTSVLISFCKGYYPLTSVILLAIILTMSTLTTITSKGQVTIPEDIRLVLQVKTGDRVSFEGIVPERKQATIRIIPGEIVEKLYGSLKTEVRFRGRDYERKMTKKLISQLAEGK